MKVIKRPLIISADARVEYILGNPEQQTSKIQGAEGSCGHHYDNADNAEDRSDKNGPSSIEIRTYWARHEGSNEGAERH